MVGVDGLLSSVGGERELKVAGFGEREDRLTEREGDAGDEGDEE